jgi:hypothetical protein
LEKFDAHHAQQVPKPRAPEPGVPPGNIPPIPAPDIPAPDPARRRSKIPAMRHFRPLPILTRSKPANQIPRIRRCARAA